MDLVELWKQEQATHWQEVAAEAREAKLVALVRRCYSKRNNGAWYRSALRVNIQELRAARR